MEQTMLVARKVNDCDFTGERFEEPQNGFAVICRGASGRYCEVMWGGETAMAEQGVTADDLMTYEEARQAIADAGDGYPDF
jgi:hypothetical protein